jgi:invasion protein IalB
MLNCGLEREDIWKMTLNIKIRSEKPGLRLFLAMAILLAVMAGSFMIFGGNEREVQQPAFKTFSGLKVPAAEPEISRSADFGDWHLECYKPDGNMQRPCRIFQKLTYSEGDKASNILTASIVMAKGKAPDREGDVLIPVMRLVAPLGVHLPSGVTLQFEKGEQFNALYQLCSPMGCIAERGLGKKILDKMNGRETMVVAYRYISQSTPTPQVMGISLKGFTKAFRALAQQENNT